MKNSCSIHGHSCKENMNDHVINTLISINYFASHLILYMAWKNSVPLRLCVETAFRRGLGKNSVQICWVLKVTMAMFLYRIVTGYFAIFVKSHEEDHLFWVCDLTDVLSISPLFAFDVTVLEQR